MRPLYSIQISSNLGIPDEFRYRARLATTRNRATSRRFRKNAATGWSPSRRTASWGACSRGRHASQFSIQPEDTKNERGALLELGPRLLGFRSICVEKL